MTTQPTLFNCTKDEGRINPGVFTQLEFFFIKLQDAQDWLDELLEQIIFEILLKDIPKLTATESLAAKLIQLVKEEIEAQRASEAEATALR